MDRQKKIIRSSIISVIGNIVLAAAKGVVGAMTGSVAITLDAVNSITDAFGSIIAIIGTKLAGQSASHDHPFGFGRVEYLTSIIIAALILAAGFSSFFEAVRSIMNPTTPQYSFITLAVVVVAALVKFGLGVYLLRLGKNLNSDTLVGSGSDSLMDGGVSFATFLAGIIYILSGLQVESWLAAGIALLIIRTGAKLLISTASKLLGERVSPEVAEQVEQEVRAVDGVQLASGLVLLDFGPQQVSGSIHITVDGQMTIAEYDVVAREVQARVRKNCNVTLAGVTPYPATENSEEARTVRNALGRIVWKNEHVVDLSGLYVEPATRTARFDAIADFEVKDLDQLQARIVESCMSEFPDWQFDVRALRHVGD